MKTTFIIVFAVVFCISCRNDIKPTIQKEFLKSDWIIPDTAFFFVEDSLALFNEIHFENFIIYKITISNDSLFLHHIFSPYRREEYKVIFKILELTKNNFHLQFVSSSLTSFRLSPNQKLFFQRDTTIKNNIKIKNLEFSSSRGMEGSFPTLDMRINDDSTLYLMDYNGLDGERGLFQHKLSRVEFERINRKFNRINLDSLKLGHGAPDASFFTFLLNTKDSLTFKYSGCLCFYEFQKDLMDITKYLSRVKLLLKFEKSKLDTLLIQADVNRERINWALKNYAP